MGAKIGARSLIVDPCSHGTLSIFLPLCIHERDVLMPERDVFNVERDVWMPRAAIGKKVQVTLPDDVLERIPGNRSEFIRKAVLQAVSGLDSDVVPARLREAAVSSGALVERAKEVASRKPPAKPVAPAVAPVKRSGGIGFDERMAGLSARLSAGRASDCRVVVEALRERRMSERDLERALGWVGIRCQNAVMALMGAGVVSTESGLLGVVDEGL